MKKMPIKDTTLNFNTVLMVTTTLMAITASILATTMLAKAADIADINVPRDYFPPIVNEPVQYNDVQSFSGWYLRGDIGANWNQLRKINYLTNTGYADFSSAKLKSSFSAGAGIGYQINKHLRTDLTLDYIFNTKFNGTTGPGGPCTVDTNPPGQTNVNAPDCVSNDTTSYQAWSLLANAYVDLYTYNQITAYAGAGIGATYLKWDTLNNVECDNTTSNCHSVSLDHEGEHGWRATAALMTGASIELTCALSADLGYRYRYIAGGRMFERLALTSTGPGFHKAIHSHEGRIGLRYRFGGCEEEIPFYEMREPLPVYK